MLDTLGLVRSKHGSYFKVRTYLFLDRDVPSFGNGLLNFYLQLLPEVSMAACYTQGTSIIDQIKQWGAEPNRKDIGVLSDTVLTPSDIL